MPTNFDSNALKNFDNAIKADINAGKYDGAVALIAADGVIKHHEAYGMADKANGIAMTKSKVFATFSFTKTMTGIAVMRAIERGRFRLDTKVADIIPGFGVGGKQTITIDQLLTHSSGLVGFVGLAPADQANLDTVMNAIIQTVPIDIPGRTVQYSAFVGFAVLGRCVELVDETSRDLRTILDQDIFTPLGMNKTSLGGDPALTPDKVPVVFKSTGVGLLNGPFMEGLGVEIFKDTAPFANIPAAGAIATAEDIFILNEMLRQGGTYKGKRILSQQSVANMVKNITGKQFNPLYNYAVPMYNLPPFRSNLGRAVWLRGEQSQLFHPFGITSPPNTVGGVGAGSNVAWTDPDKGIVFVCMTSGLIEEMEAFLRAQKLSDLVQAAAIT